MNATQRILVLALITLAMALLNLLGPMMFDGARDGELSGYLAFFAAGGLLGQGCLAATWAALGARSVLVRVPVSLGLLVLAACAYNIGLRIQDDDFPLDAAIAVFIAALLLYVSMQVPLWIMRSRMQCRIDLAEADLPTRDEESMQFGVRHLLLWTTVIAVIVALVKSALPSESPVTAAPWGSILFGMAVVGIFTTVVAIPCIALSLGEGARGVWPVWLGVAGIFGPVAVVMLLSMAFGTPPDFGEVLLAIYCLGAGTVSCLLVTFWILRGMGYRLRGVAEVPGAAGEGEDAGGRASPGESPFGESPFGESPFAEARADTEPPRPEH